MFRFAKRRPAFRPALRFEPLEDRATPAITAIGAAAGGAPRVQVFVDGRSVADFFAYDESFRGGVSVAVGDVNGDGFQDVVTGVGAGGGPNVKVFLGTGTRAVNFGNVTQTQTGISTTAAASFFAYDQSFAGGVQVAVGNVDPTNDILIPSTNSRVQSLTSGVRDEIVTAPLENGGPNVRVFGNAAAVPTLPALGGFGDPLPPNAVDLVNNTTFATTFNGNAPRSSFFAFEDPNYRGGLNLAVGSLNAFPSTVFPGASTTGQRVYQASALAGVDGFEDIVVGAGVTGSPRVVALKNRSTQDATTGAVTYGGFDTNQKLADFFAYNDTFRGGVYVGIGDQNGDGVPDLITGVGPGGGPNVRVFAATTTALTLTSPPFSGTTLPAFLATPYGATVALNTGGAPITGPIDQVLLYSGINTGTPYASFFAADDTYAGGVRVRSVAPGQIETSYGAGFPGVTRLFTSDPAVFPTTPPSTFQFRPNTYVALATGGAVYDPQFMGGLNIAQGDTGGFMPI